MIAFVLSLRRPRNEGLSMILRLALTQVKLARTRAAPSVLLLSSLAPPRAADANHTTRTLYNSSLLEPHQSRYAVLRSHQAPYFW